MDIEASHPRKWYGDNLWTISTIQTFLGLAAPRSGERWRESNVSKVSKIQEMGNGAILSLIGVFLDVVDGRVNHLMTRLRYCVRTRYGGGPILGSWSRLMDKTRCFPEPRGGFRKSNISSCLHVCVCNGLLPRLILYCESISLVCHRTNADGTIGTTRRKWEGEQGRESELFWKTNGRWKAVVVLHEARDCAECSLSYFGLLASRFGIEEVW